MQLHFYKYQGTGNDFILADNRDGHFSHASVPVTMLCDRRFGIGSDGLILLETDPEASFRMEFFNPDGSQSFCGNGSRCAVLFAHHLGMDTTSIRFRAIDGLHEAVHAGDEIRIHMMDVPSVESLGGGAYFIHTGSPHYVAQREDVSTLDICSLARPVRYSERFAPGGTNVNYFREVEAGIIEMRTYERGVEDETLSCGTGVTGAALVYASMHPGITEVGVHTRGGKLRVTFERTENGFTQVWLCGPAQMVYEGTIEL